MGNKKIKTDEVYELLENEGLRIGQLKEKGDYKTLKRNNITFIK